MYTLVVDSNIREFYSYLNDEATLVGPDTFLFSSRSTANKTIARFMLYFIRKQTINDLISSKKLSETDVDDFLLHIPSDEIALILQKLTEKLTTFLLSHETLHFEGFLQFRLKEEKDRLSWMMQNALSDFVQENHPTSQLASLENILHTQPSRVDELFIVIEEKQRIVLRSHDKIFLVEHAKNEDMVLSHLIVLAPKSVKVHETHGNLTKETIIILQRLFKQKVVFSREKFYSNQHRKK